uniref:Serpentine receptor class gamma n=1 Tax=Panagrolaimus sp. PS1159 TaxID=55785 RepID=A0AC35GXA6_9BILA
MVLTVHNYIRTFFYLTLTPFHISPWLITNLWQLQLSWFASNYSVCQQAFIHASIAINRAWIAFFGMKQKKYSLSEYGRRAIWILPFVAIPQCPQTFGAHYVYEVLENGDLASYFAESWAQSFWNIISPIGMFSTASITFICAMITIFRYRYLLKTSGTHISMSIVQDMRLFTQAFVLLILQLAFVGYYIISNVFADSAFFMNIASDLFYYVSDAYSFCNPIALLIVSKNIRYDYLYFYGIKKSNVVSVQSLSWT